MVHNCIVLNKLEKKIISFTFSSTIQFSLRLMKIDVENFEIDQGVDFEFIDL